jgi:hypothetical protein
MAATGPLFLRYRSCKIAAQPKIAKPAGEDDKAQVEDHKSALLPAQRGGAVGEAEAAKHDACSIRDTGKFHN